jgi:hypothetical protein
VVQGAVCRGGRGGQGWTDAPGGAFVPPKPYPGSPVGSPGPGFPRVTTRGMATFVRNITGTLVVVQGADILEQGEDDDGGGPAAGPITSALG